jgi:t-SNARE complex subunit (syntaxin)
MKINDSKESIARLDTQVTRIEQLHAQSLNAPEGASHAELDSLVASTSGLIGSIRANLERLGKECRTGGPDAKKKVDLVNAQRRSLQQRVHRFQMIEKQYRDKLTERAVRQYRIGTPHLPSPLPLLYQYILTNISQPRYNR